MMPSYSDSGVCRRSRTALLRSKIRRCSSPVCSASPRLAINSSCSFCTAVLTAEGQIGRIIIGFFLTACSTARASSSVPRLRVATVGTTGTPRRCSRSLQSICRPFFSATSQQFSAITIGTSSSDACEARNRLRCKFSTSTTTMIRSGAGRPSTRPASTSTAIRSSSELALRL